MDKTLEKKIGKIKISTEGIIREINNYGQEILDVNYDLVGKKILEIIPEYSLDDIYINNIHYSIRLIYSMDIVVCSYLEIEMKSINIIILFTKTHNIYNLFKNIMSDKLMESELEILNEIMDDNNEHQITYEHIKHNGIVSVSKEMQDILTLITRIASANANVLITGETGVGKNVLAKVLHDASERKAGPFIDINCSTMHENLIESELFGYEKGSFTGAREHGKVGKIELANKGTLFLDEIGELSIDVQKKLLQVIQEKKISKIGGNTYIDIDFNLISATNKNLKELVNKGLFREDLYYRLNVIPIHIPPLRERKDDIVPLLLYFLRKYNRKYKKNKSFEKDTIKILCEYHWPGNVRELENIIERLIITSTNNNIDVNELPEFFISAWDKKKNIKNTNLKEMLEKYEKRLIIDAYKEYKTSIMVAHILGISQTTAARKIRKYIFNRK